ncbi:MAG: hypothetical protein ACF8XB_09305, partial [Planctomycetota bacterium JB042]
MIDEAPNSATARAPSLRTALALLVAFLSCAATGLARDDEHLPVRVEVTVDDADLPSTGVFTLRLRFEPTADLERAHLLRVVVGRGRRELVSRDVVPDPQIGR